MTNIFCENKFIYIRCFWIKLFSSRLENLKEVYRRHQLDQEQLKEDLVQTVKELDDGKERAPLLAQRFNYYQELRGYVTDLVECLDEKVGWYAVTFFSFSKSTKGFPIPRSASFDLSFSFFSLSILKVYFSHFSRPPIHSRKSKIQNMIFNSLNRIERK